MLVFLLSLVWGWRMVTFQLSGFYCMLMWSLGSLVAWVTPNIYRARVQTSNMDNALGTRRNLLGCVLPEGSYHTPAFGYLTLGLGY